MGCTGGINLENKNNTIIKAEIEIEQDNLNCQIINSINYFMSLNPSFSLEDEDYENGKKQEQELKNSDIFINDKKIKFDYFYEFKKRGKYKIKYIFQNPLTSLKFLFYNCENIITLDFSKFRQS